jgi:predicted amidohydrolase YtcJ
VRVNEFLSWELLPALRRLGFRTGGAGRLVRFGPVKVFVDGGAGTGTAAFRTGDGPWRTPPGELAALVLEAQGGGLQVAAHCIGDGAIEAFVSAVEAAQGAHPGPLRHRVEHCTYCPPDLQARMARAGMVAVMQPLFSSFGRGRLGAEIGPGAERHVAAHRDLLRSGVVVAFSSDLPVVSDPNPWAGLAAAVIDPEQPLTRLQALRAYTVGGAWTTFEEGVKGSLEVGRLADFQVYEVDPLELPPGEWPALRPRLVALDGRPVLGSL